MSAKFGVDRINNPSLLRILETSESKLAGSVKCSTNSNDMTASQVPSQNGNCSAFATID